MAEDSTRFCWSSVSPNRRQDRVVRFRRPAREHDPFRLAAQKFTEPLARLLELPLRGPGLVVERGRIVPVLFRGAQPGLARGRRCSGVVALKSK